VVVGGHFDSWDVGTGMTDDAGGCLMALESLHLMSSLGLRPRRTVRAVFFTNEENGARGAAAYLSQHAHEVNRTVFALESDQGLSTPYGYSFQGNAAALPTLQALADQLKPALNLKVQEGGAGVDIGPLCDAGVPGVGLLNDEFDGSHTDYFDVHHTMADTFDKLSLEELRQSLAAVVSMVFQVANMEGTLPRIHAPTPQ
jgi:carboxypeptidase Q